HLSTLQHSSTRHHYKPTARGVCQSAYSPSTALALAWVARKLMATRPATSAARPHRRARSFMATGIGAGKREGGEARIVMTAVARSFRSELNRW
ncbi:unnamed protein product, partial [Closterium sp. Naga37s-1]